MAAQITLPTRTRDMTAARERWVVSLLNWCVLTAIFLTVVFVLAAIKTYFTYQDFAELIDQQIATGYLRSHSGLYALRG